MNPAMIPAVISGGKALWDTFGPKQNPMQQANQYLNQIPGVAHQAYDPFVQRGQQAGQQASQQYGQMASNPNDWLSKLMSGYQQSPQFQGQQNNALQAMRSSAAAGGRAGSQWDQRNQAELAQSMLGEDMQRYLQNVLGIQGAGMQGQEQDITRGYNASGSLTDILGGLLNQQGGMGWQHAMNRNSQSRQNSTNIMQALAAMFNGQGGGNPFMGGSQGSFPMGGPSSSGMNWMGGS